MTRWELQVSDETDRSVREYLARTEGEQGDLARFVDETMRGEILRRTVRDIQEKNSDLSEADAQALADEAVTWARANRT